MIEPSEDSFETMMERKNPSSKQMESSEGSSNTTAEREDGAQAGAGPAPGPAQPTEEMPTVLLQDMEEPSSVPDRKIKDSPNDLLQDLEEACVAAEGDPAGEEPGEMGEASVNAWGDPDEDDDTDLSDWGDDDLEEPPAASSSEFGATFDSLVSAYFQMQDLREQQRVAEEILVRGLNEGRLPRPEPFSGDRRQFHEFIVLCQLILQSYPRKFFSDRRRVRYVTKYLSGTALEWARGLAQEGSPLLSDFPAFLEAMSQVFEYKQSLRAAEDAMFEIRQGDRPAIDYINEFRALVPTLGWPDGVLQAHLCLGLKEEIRHYLFRVPQPDSLDSLIVLVLQIEEKLAERRAVLRLPPESRPRNMTWIDSPAPEKWAVDSWLSYEVQPIDRRHLFLLLLVRVNPYHSVAVQALVDSGASSNFMDERFAQEHYVELYEKPYPQRIHIMDGSLIGNEPVWLHTEPLVCMHQNHQETIQFDIVPSPNVAVVLGIDWLRIHAPQVDWVKGRCTFHSPYCLKNCFRPPPPCIALEKHAVSLLPGLSPQYSDLADVFNPKEADEETSDQPSSDGSDDLSESEPSELQQAGDSDQSSETDDESPSSDPQEPADAEAQKTARRGNEDQALEDMLTKTVDCIQSIPVLFNPLHGAKWFTRLELRGTTMDEDMKILETEEVWKAAFGMELQAMESYQPFQICADPLIPQKVLLYILRDMLGKFVLSYGHDVVIYSMSQEEHLLHVRQVLVRFRHHYVYCSLDRSEFHRHNAEVLAFILTPKGVRLSKNISNTIRGYPIPGSKKSLRHLIQFMFPYRHFVERFAVTAEPLVRQLLSSAPFHWGDEEQEAFESLKRAFRKAPLLHHPKPQNPFYLDTGITRTALYASLIQIDEHNGKRVYCAFYSRYLAPDEVDLPPLERRGLVIRAALKVWRCYLENTEEPIMILLNTEDLASLNNDRLTVILPGQWVGFFSRFHWDIMERPEQDSGWVLPPRHSHRRPFQARSAAWPWRPIATGGGEGGEAPPQAQSQEFLTQMPLDQVLLVHFSVAQIKAVVLNFFSGLLFWKDNLALAALLVILKEKQRPPPLPAPTLDVARLPVQRSPRLILDESLLTNPGIAATISRLLTQMPPDVDTDAVRADQRALLPRGPRVLHLPPEFWMMLGERFGIRVAPGQPQPIRLGSHSLELHVVGGDVVLREALQDDLQRYRQSGLHDGLQDTSQDAQADDDAQGDDQVQGDQVQEEDGQEEDAQGDQVQEDDAQGDQVQEDDAQGDQVQEDDAQGDQVQEDDGKEDDGQGDQVQEDDGQEDDAQGDQVQEDDGKDDGQGDQVQEDDGQEDDAQGDQVQEDDGQEDDAQGDQVQEDDGQGDQVQDDDGQDDAQGDQVQEDDGQEDDAQGDQVQDDGQEDDAQGDQVQEDDGQEDDAQGNQVQEDDGQEDDAQGDQVQEDDGQEDDAQGDQVQEDDGQEDDAQGDQVQEDDGQEDDAQGDQVQEDDGQEDDAQGDQVQEDDGQEDDAQGDQVQEDDGQEDDAQGDQVQEDDGQEDDAQGDQVQEDDGQEDDAQGDQVQEDDGQEDDAQGDQVQEDDGQEDDAQGDQVQEDDGQEDDGQGDQVQDDNGQDEGQGDQVQEDDGQDDTQGDQMQEDDGQEDDAQGDQVQEDDGQEDDGQGDQVQEDDGQGDQVQEDDGQEDDGQGDQVQEDDGQEDDGQGDQVQEDDGQGDQVQEDDGQGDQVQGAGALDPYPALPEPPQASGGILGFLHSHVYGPQDQPSLAQPDPAARSLAHFLAMICAEDPVPLRGRQPRGRARLEELPEDDEDPEDDDDPDEQ